MLNCSFSFISSRAIAEEAVMFAEVWIGLPVLCFVSVTMRLNVPAFVLQTGVRCGPVTSLLCSELGSGRANTQPIFTFLWIGLHG